MSLPYGLEMEALLEELNSNTILNLSLLLSTPLPPPPHTLETQSCGTAQTCLEYDILLPQPHSLVGHPHTVTKNCASKNLE